MGNQDTLRRGADIVIVIKGKRDQAIKDGIMELLPPLDQFLWTEIRVAGVIFVLMRG